MPTETTTKTKVSTRSIAVARVVAATGLVLSMGVLGFTAGIAYFKAQSNVYQSNYNAALTIFGEGGNINGPTEVTEGCGFIPTEEACIEAANCDWECECQEDSSSGNGNWNENRPVNDNTNTPPENNNTPADNGNNSL